MALKPKNIKEARNHGDFHKFTPNYTNWIRKQSPNSRSIETHDEWSRKHHDAGSPNRRALSIPPGHQILRNPAQFSPNTGKNESKSRRRCICRNAHPERIRRALKESPSPDVFFFLTPLREKSRLPVKSRPASVSRRYRSVVGFLLALKKKPASFTLSKGCH